jgi:putative thioredoxin
MSMAIAVTSRDFERTVIEASASRPVLVDFWAPWCAPCRALAPLLDKLAVEFADRLTLAKLNTDEEPQVAQAFGIRGIPCCKLFIDGRVVDEFTGVLPESQLREFLRSALPSPAASLVESAKARLAAEDAEGALRDAEAASAIDAQDEDVALTRLEALVALGRLVEAQRSLEALETRPLRDEQRFAAIKSRLGFGEFARTDLAELERRASATPADNAAKLDYAKALAARGRYEPALQTLLDILRNDRAFGDDAARRTMVAIFAALGADSDLARRYRREMAAAINR